MMKLRTNHATWVESGRKAAESGKTGEALSAMMTLFGFLFAGITTIIDNQFDLYEAINKAQSGGQKKP